MTASNGHVVESDGRMEDPPDLLTVPGGGWNDRAKASAGSEAEHGMFPAAIAEYHGAGATVAGVCIWAMLLARASLLGGRFTVTHAGAVDDFRETEWT